MKQPFEGRVRTWGNTIAVRIPLMLAKELEIKPMDRVKVTIHKVQS